MKIKYKELGNTSARLLLDLERVLEANKDKLQKFVLGIVKGNLIYFYTCPYRPLTNRKEWDVSLNDITLLPYPEPIYHHSEKSIDCLWEIIK